jgi:tetratricopeptide (TPR) repeat protein
VNQSRVELLKKFIEDDPSDPFNYYALALEYQLTEPVKAGELFDYLLVYHSDYLPMYYIAGVLFADLGNETKALSIFNKGIELARSRSELKVLRELQSALLNLE